MKAIRFGESVEGYRIPVLNEREVRASAGILFLVLFSAWMQILFNDNFTPIKYAITFFLTDFAIRLFVNPRYSPALIMGRIIVRGQTPEYVGAPQKKFAWTIGLVLSATMFIFMVVMNSYSVFSSISCLICLVFLFFESAFGICLGCKLYDRFYKEKAQYCPGDICEAKPKQEIQKISLAQVCIVCGFFAYCICIAYLFGESFSEKPTGLWVLISAALSK